jgi:hypothetical protein
MITTWSKDELRRIADADDLHISPFREDGVTYGTPTWIWSVAVDGALYVRGYNGKKSRWYLAAMRQKAGRIIAAGMTKEVTFEQVDGPINSRIDDAYRSKYHDSPYLNPDDQRSRSRCDSQGETTPGMINASRCRQTSCRKLLLLGALSLLVATATMTLSGSQNGVNIGAQDWLFAGWRPARLDVAVVFIAFLVIGLALPVLPLHVHQGLGCHFANYLA